MKTNTTLRSCALASAVLLTACLVYGTTGTQAIAAPKTTKTVTVAPSGDKYGNRDFHAIGGYTSQGGYRIVLEKGTYYLNGMLRVNSNTYLDAGKAKIIEKKAGAKLVTQPDNRTSTKAKSKIKGYNAVHDITIDGGVWQGTKKYRTDSTVKNGQKVGPNVFNFIHAKNITIKNATIYNVLNAHLIELCGVKNGKIVNCTLGAYRTASGKLKRGKAVGAAYRGAVQLDMCGSALNNPSAGSFDGTKCRNITISGNYIWNRTALQAASGTKGVKVTKNTFRCKTTIENAGGISGLKQSKNKKLKY